MTRNLNYVFAIFLNLKIRFSYIRHLWGLFLTSSFLLIKGLHQKFVFQFSNSVFLSSIQSTLATITPGTNAVSILKK